MQLATIHSPNAATVVAATGELDVATTPELRRVLHTAIDEHPTPLIVDLTDVLFLDSTALSVLVSAHKKLTERGQTLTLISPHERLLRIFDLTALDRVFTIISALSADTRPAAR